MQNSGQRADRVAVSGDGDVDGQLGTLEMPQAGVLRVSSVLKPLVHLLGDGVWDLVP